MDYLKTTRAAENVDFRSRIKAALFDIAQMVIAEPADTPGHYERLLMARAVTYAPDTYVNQAAWLAASTEAVYSTTLTAAGVTTVAASDVVVRSLVLAAWNAVAGAPA